jgi:hypothetical protein
MGTIAKDMRKGRCCSECGIYFKQKHGYPVLCKDCWDYTPQFEGEVRLPKSVIKEL